MTMRLYCLNINIICIVEEQVQALYLSVLEEKSELLQIQLSISILIQGVEQPVSVFWGDGAGTNTISGKLTIYCLEGCLSDGLGIRVSVSTFRNI